MDHESGKKSVPPDPLREALEQAGDDEPGGTLNPLPEVMRRVVAAGLSGFFLTEEAIRRALGDTMPKDWSDFAVEQSERTRKELLDRLTSEMGRFFEGVDVTEVLSSLLAGQTVEVKAEFRLRPNDPDGDSKVEAPAGDE